jgi:integrase
MASIHRRSNTKYWHAAWRDANGVLHLRSTRHTDKGKALAAALDFEAAEELAKEGNLTEAQARDILNEILRRGGVGEQLTARSAREYLNDWLTGEKRNPATAERYGKVVEGFLEHLGPQADRPLRFVQRKQVRSFIASRVTAGLSPTTVNQDGKILRAAFKAAHVLGDITLNPAVGFKLPEPDSVERETFSKKEIDLLLAAAEGEWRTMIMLGYYAGARLQDCCNACWTGDREDKKKKWQEGVDLAGRTLVYWQQKTQKLVLVPISSKLLAHLEGLASTDNPNKFIMPGMAGLKPGGRHGLSEGFKRIMKKAGLDLMQVQGGGKRKICRRTFHSLRHTFASRLAAKGVPIEQRMHLTGHKSEDVAQGYTHPEMTSLREAVEHL